MNAVAAAHLIAKLAHEGQTDRLGLPYITHPEYVADHVSTDEEKIVAYLHDVVEDTDVTEAELREIFGDRIGDAVALLTHDPKIPYLDYVRKLKDDPLARAVKLADLAHNSLLSRLPDPTERDFERLKRYAEAKKILED